ncbi:MAG: DUF4258 domain-containing protein [Candidatus Brocadiia bacterium]
MPRGPRRQAEWLAWDLEISDHAAKRSVLRGFSETDLRTMLSEPSGFEPSAHEGRFVVHSRLGRERWRIVVEPDPEERKLMVVTAWRV